MRLASIWVPIVVVLSACVVRLPSEEGGGSGETGATDDVDPTSAGTVIVGETDDEATTTVAAATGATDEATTTVAAATGETESVGETATEGTGGFEDPPAACAAPADPAVAAAFALDLSAWALENDEQFGVDVACVVDAVDVVDAEVVTAMTCEVEGVPLATGLTIDAAPEGEVAWAAGAAVRLEAFSVDLSDLGMPPDRVVELRAADDDALLVAAIDVGGDLAAPWYAPIVIDTTVVCAPEEAWGVPSPLMLDFSRIDAPEAGVTLFEGHRAALDVAGDASFMIDVRRANTNNCCHFLRDFEVLIRRIQVG
jgi:hypothetical protein